MPDAQISALWSALTFLAAGLPSTPADLMALLALAAAGFVLTLVVSQVSATRPHDATSSARVIALRRRARRSEFLRQRDPDAAGRSRPRAPSAA